MELEGKVIQDLGLTEGISKAGKPWKKREWVLETFGNWPRRVKFQFFGDRADSNVLEVGKCYAVGIDIESREFNGRWYTDVSGYSTREIADPAMGGGAPQFAGEPAPAYSQAAGGSPFQQAAQPFAAPEGDQSDDLPF